MSYDVKCHELAVAFLSDFPDLAPARRKVLEHELAQQIQTRIEDFLEAQFEDKL